MDTTAEPSAQLEDGTDEAVLTLAGDWTIKSRERGYETILEDLPKLRAKNLRVNADSIGQWDSSLLIFLGKVDERCQKSDVKFERDTLPESIGSLIALAQAGKETGRGKEKPPSFLATIGNAALGGWQSLVSALTFAGEVTLSFLRIVRGRAPVDWRLFWLTMQETGPQALPIVSLISFLTGLILAFVGSIQLRQFGAGLYVANLVAVAMAREMGAIMTGVIMAGRTGAAFAAQLGSMKVSEELDALTTLAISPTDFLVSPRILALLLMMPLLVLYSDLIGILGGAVVGLGSLKISATQYWNQTLGAMSYPDVLTGFYKGSIFGIIVALTGCQRGIRCGNDAAAVGNAATSAVVLAITWIVASDAVLDVLQEMLHL